MLKAYFNICHIFFLHFFFRLPTSCSLIDPIIPMKRTPLKRYDTERRWTFVMSVSIWLSCSFLIYRTSIVVLWEKHSNELQCHRKVQPQFQFFIKCHLSTPYTSIWILYATYKMGTKFVEKCKNWKHIKWRMKCDQTQYKIALLAFHLKI